MNQSKKQLRLLIQLARLAGFCKGATESGVDKEYVDLKIKAEIGNIAKNIEKIFNSK